MTNKRGGARPGAGRPKGTGHAIKEDTAKRYTIRLTDKDLAIFKANGGIKTLRYLLNNDKFKSPD